MGGCVYLGLVLQQEPHHVHLAEVASDVEGRVAGLGHGVNLTTKTLCVNNVMVQEIRFTFKIYRNKLGKHQNNAMRWWN